MEHFKNLKRVAMNELKKLDTAYANKEEFDEKDAKMYDCLMHALKCQLTAEAMMGPESHSEGDWSGGGDPMRQPHMEGYRPGYYEPMPYGYRPRY